MGKKNLKTLSKKSSEKSKTINLLYATNKTEKTVNSGAQIPRNLHTPKLKRSSGRVYLKIIRDSLFSALSAHTL